MKEEILKKVDHTLLKQTSTWEDIKKLCDDAIKCNTASVCIPPCFVKQAKEYVGDKMKICTVIGFPNGYNLTKVKMYETEQAVEDGADEIDMVINIGALKDKDYKTVREDIEAVVNIAKQKSIVKVIIETSLLNEEEKRIACELSKEAKADFVKTSTGFSTAGATVEDIILMKSVVNDNLEIKASGGVKDLKTAKEMVEAGATRLGTSSGIKIVKEL